MHTRIYALINKFLAVVVVSTFLFSNVVYASGGVGVFSRSLTKDTLAVQSRIHDVLLGSQLMYTADKALETALINDVSGVHDLYRILARLRADFESSVQEVSEELKSKVMWLVFSDKENSAEKAFYIFIPFYRNSQGSPIGVYFRYTTSPNVKDEFYSVLEKYANRLGDAEQVKVNGGGFYREKYQFSGLNLSLINEVLEEIYEVMSPASLGTAEQLYQKMIKHDKVYTVNKAADELQVSKEKAGQVLEWLADLNREIEVGGKFKGIEKITRQGKIIYQWLNPEAINPDIFRDYDYRSPTQGSVDFSPKRLFFMTLTWISMAKEKAKQLGIQNRNILIARDCRKTDPAVIEAMIRAVEYSGLQAVYVGENPNSAASYAWAVRKHEPLVGLFLTASHVRAEDVMGAKVSIRGSSGELESLTTAEIKQGSRKRLDKILRDPNKLGLIRTRCLPRINDDVLPTYQQMATMACLVATGSFRSGRTELSLYDFSNDLEMTADILATLGDYEKEIDRAARPLSGLKVVIEASHTPSGKLAAGVYEALGAEVIILNEEIWELTGNHKADPSIIDNLDELMGTMQTSGAHFGVAFDLDGDRGAIVLPTREIDTVTGRRFTALPPDNLVEALLPFFDKRGYSVGERGKVAVVRDVLSTNGVDKKAEEFGYEIHQTDAGYVFLKAKVKPLKEAGYTVPVYAERSGHAWTHTTGAFEDPIVVSLFFAIIGQEYLAEQPQASHPFLDAFRQNTIPYKQSTRFQPLFGELLLKELSVDPENKTGWTWEQGKPPTAIIALGKHRVIKMLGQDFKQGAVFSTPAGVLKVSEFNCYFDPEALINRFADIRFTIDGKDAGSFVFRASSNDPTWVCAFEVPLWDNESFTSEIVQLRYDAVGGVVLDYLEQKGLARVTGEDFNYSNKADAETTLTRYRQGMSANENAAQDSDSDLPVQAPIAKRVQLGEAVATENGVSIWEAKLSSNGELARGRVLNADLYNNNVKNKLYLLKGKRRKDKEQEGVLRKIKKKYGAGMFAGVDRIRIVDNIEASRRERVDDLFAYSMVKEEAGEKILLLDKDAFDNKNKLFLVLTHELRHELLTIVEPGNPALRELISGYLSIKDALREGITDVGDVRDLPKENQFLQLVKFLKGKSDEEIIAAIIECMRDIQYYQEDLFKQFDFSGEWKKRILTEITGEIVRYQAALNVFNSIAEAKEMVRQIKVGEEKMVVEQSTKGSMDREELLDVYQAFNEVLDWYSLNPSEVLFIDTKWPGVAARRLTGEVERKMTESDLEGSYDQLWKLLGSEKGISSIVISDDSIDRIRASGVRFINIIKDILVAASEVDFIGYRELNGLTIKVTEDAGGKRIVIGGTLFPEVDPSLDRLLASWEETTAGLPGLLEGIVTTGTKQTEESNVVKVDIDSVSEANIREIRTLTEKYSDSLIRFYYFSSSGRDVSVFLDEHKLEQADLTGVPTDNMITLVDPTRLKLIQGQEEARSGYYLPVLYLNGSISMAVVVVLVDRDIEGLRRTGILNIIASLYEEILGRRLTDSEVMQLLRDPWMILPEIEGVLGDLNTIGRMIKMIAMAA